MLIRPGVGTRLLKAREGGIINVYGHSETRLFFTLPETLIPGVDWLLLIVETVADWLFMAVVEQQAGGVLRKQNEIR